MTDEMTQTEPTIAFTEGPERERLMKLFQSINNGLVMRDTSVVLDLGQ